MDGAGTVGQIDISYVGSFAISLSPIGSPFTAFVERKLLPVGPAYLAHVKRAVHQLTFDEHDKHAEEERKRLEAMNGTAVDGEDDLGVGDEPEDEDLLSLDPKEWKVRAAIALRLTDSQLYPLHRNKTTTRSLDSHICGIRRQTTRLRLLVRTISSSSYTHVTSALSRQEKGAQAPSR